MPRFRLRSSSSNTKSNAASPSSLSPEANDSGEGFEVGSDEDNAMTPVSLIGTTSPVSKQKFGKRKISREEIGFPTNFVHKNHVDESNIAVTVFLPDGTATSSHAGGPPVLTVPLWRAVSVSSARPNLSSTTASSEQSMTHLSKSCGVTSYDQEVPTISDEESKGEAIDHESSDDEEDESFGFGSAFGSDEDMFEDDGSEHSFSRHPSVRSNDSTWSAESVHGFSRQPSVRSNWSSYSAESISGFGRVNSVNSNVSSQSGWSGISSARSSRRRRSGKTRRRRGSSGSTGSISSAEVNSGQSTPTRRLSHISLGGFSHDSIEDNFSRQNSVMSPGGVSSMNDPNIEERLAALPRQESTRSAKSFEGFSSISSTNTVIDSLDTHFPNDSDSNRSSLRGFEDTSSISSTPRSSFRGIDSDVQRRNIQNRFRKTKNDGNILQSTYRRPEGSSIRSNVSTDSNRFKRWLPRTLPQTPTAEPIRPATRTVRKKLPVLPISTACDTASDATPMVPGRSNSSSNFGKENVDEDDFPTVQSTPLSHPTRKRPKRSVRKPYRNVTESMLVGSLDELLQLAEAEERSLENVDDNRPTKIRKFYDSQEIPV